MNQASLMACMTRLAQLMQDLIQASAVPYTEIP